MSIGLLNCMYLAMLMQPSHLRDSAVLLRGAPLHRRGLLARLGRAYFRVLPGIAFVPKPPIQLPKDRSPLFGSPSASTVVPLDSSAPSPASSSPASSPMGIVGATYELDETGADAPSSRAPSPSALAPAAIALTPAVGVHRSLHVKHVRGSSCACDTFFSSARARGYAPV